MIKPRFILFCDYALISQEGRLSIIGEFDHLFSTGEKALLSRAFLVASLITNPNKGLTLLIHFINEEERDEVLSKEIGVTSGPDGRMNIVLGFETLTFNSFGIYKAKISEGNKLIAEARLHVVQVKQPKPAES